MFEFLKMILTFFAQFLSMLLNIEFYNSIKFGHIIIFSIFLALIVGFFLKRKGSDK